ncbi:hypothetical protein Dimus_020180 [Dionaea muscipula]
MLKPVSLSPFRLSSLLRLEKDPKLALQLFLNPNPNRHPNHTPWSLKPFRYSLLSYDLIIAKLGRAKMFDELDQILSRLKLETRFSPTEIIFCNIITYYSRARLPEKALVMYDQIPSFRCRRSVKSLNTLLNGLLTCSEFDKMRRIFLGIERLACPDAATYNIMMNASRALGDLDCAWKLLDEMRERGVQPNEVTFSTLICALCEGLKLKEALKLKRDMLRDYKVRPGYYVYASLIKGLCGMDELTLAVKLKDEMLENKMEMKPAIYTTLIRSLFRSGRKAEASEILEEMKRNGCRPDAVTYNALITGSCEERDFELALRLLGEMNEKGLKPDCVTYNILIHGYCKERKLSEAVDLFEDMPRLGCEPDVISHRILLDGLLDDQRLEGAAALLDEMIFKGYSPHSATTSRFVDLLLQQGNEGLLLIVLNSLAKGNLVDPKSWNMAVSTVCENDEPLNLCDIVECS